MTQKSIIITADDYGLSESVNQGILDTVRAGIITSVHVMTNYVTEEAMRALIETILEVEESSDNPRRKIGVGLHLNTTTGLPLVENNGLGSFVFETDGVHHFSLERMVRKDIPLSDMKKELRAQYDKLAEFLGSPENIDAISSGSNFHLFDKDYVKLVGELAKKAKTPVRSPVTWRKPKHLKEYEPDDNKKSTDRIRDGKLAMRVIGDAFDMVGEFLTGDLHLSTLKVFVAALEKGPKRRETLLKEGVPVVDFTSAHWFGNPKLKNIVWVHDQITKELDLRKDLRDVFAVEIFTHPANNSKAYVPKYHDPVMYEMSFRKSEHRSLVSQRAMRVAKEFEENVNCITGSYQEIFHPERRVDLTKSLLWKSA